MDWQRGKLPWYTAPPEMASRADKIKKPLALTIDSAAEPVTSKQEGDQTEEVKEEEEEEDASEVVRELSFC